MSGGNAMYKCNRCGANVDTNELHNGICDDCIEEMKQKEIEHYALMNLISEGQNGQIRMEMCV